MWYFLLKTQDLRFRCQVAIMHYKTSTYYKKVSINQLHNACLILTELWSQMAYQLYFYYFISIISKNRCSSIKLFMLPFAQNHQLDSKKLYTRRKSLSFLSYLRFLGVNVLSKICHFGEWNDFSNFDTRKSILSQKTHFNMRKTA